MSLTAKERRAAVDLAWKEGRLRYKLHPHQRAAYDRTTQQFAGEGIRRIAWRWARRLGKTFTGHLKVVEGCASIPGFRGVIGAPSEKHLKKFTMPAIEAICSDAPNSCMPRFDRAESEYRFPNGSVISIHGCDTDGKISRMSRGPAANALLFEEAGEIPNLERAIKTTAPQLLSKYNDQNSGWILVVGTPPESPAHYFVDICRRYAQQGREIHYTLYDGHYAPETLKAFLRDDADGMPEDEYKASEMYRREWLAELIGDPSRMVLKLATEAHMREMVERYNALNDQRPSHYVVYESLDVGWEDWTFWLMGWWHHRLQTLVIEKELVYKNGFKRDTLAAEIIQAEEHFLGPSRRAPYQGTSQEPRRWSDHAPELLAELSSEFNLPFNPTAKEDRDTAINQCDRMIPGYGVSGKLAINPNCKELLVQMPAATWNKTRTEFAKNMSRRYGHYDGVASLVYMTRNVVRSEDPVPVDFGVGGPGRWYEPGLRPPTEEEKWAKVFDLEVET